MCLSDAYHKENASHKPAFLDISVFGEILTLNVKKT